MKALLEEVFREEDLKKLERAIETGRCPAVISGVSGVHKAFVMSALANRSELGGCAVCANEQDAERLAADLYAFTGERPAVLTGREPVFYPIVSASRTQEQDRLTALYRIRTGQVRFVVATVEGLLLRTLPPEKMEEQIFSVKTGDTCPPDELTEALLRAGYRRSEQVEGPGQFARRGGIIDFFSPLGEEPIRVEFWDDEIDSMSAFDPSTQRRTDVTETAVILPATETAAAAEIMSQELIGRLEQLREKLESRKKRPEQFLKNLNDDIDTLKNGRTLAAADKYMEMLFDRNTTAADYLPPEWLVFFCEPVRCAERAKDYEKRLATDVTALLEAGVLEASLNSFADDWQALCRKMEEHPLIFADNFAANTYPVNPRTLCNLKTKQLSSYGGSMETALSDIAYYRSAGYRTVILCADSRRAGLLAEYLREHGVPASISPELAEMPGEGECILATGALTAGMEFPTIRLAVITEGQLIKKPGPERKRKKKSSNTQRLASYADLSPGDLVVHEVHGIGRFVGIVKMQPDGVEKDYIKIAYAGTDSLYVPATSLDVVSKYIGGGEGAPVRLNKMGGAEWGRTKEKAKSAARQMARELIDLYARRQREKGHAAGPDTVWQAEFEAGFGYPETEDQLRCVEEIKTDMERPVPMDRILCGDVGYGKTEVALRAVMKCIMDGMQAAILVPTTVLAQQHYVTVMKRFADFPVRVEVLSRFRTQSQIRKAIRDIEQGGVDIVIGTHRLLQKDIRFRKLGLLVVDEEQRFGVSHKEALKALTTQVDVLTLSATPIPRTLNMALSGIRDMSTIEEPPMNRQPVQTFVLEHDWTILADAMRRELQRGGQVYYLHNRVDTIERTAAKIAGLLDGATVAVAHGKMEEDSLSEVMERMSAGEIQVLVCTTIIETGIDIPNVNTLIIEDADRLGLAQLHQIRGRVGRSPRRAYAYFTFRQGKALTEVAEKRLSAIREFAEFNSGFKIAMRDLEIRGAGNLLGAEQSGHMISVGYDMYLKLLEEAVLEEKGEKADKRTECAADLSVSANIPDSYVPSGEQRIDLYRRIAWIRTDEDADEMIAELIDRFGDPPAQVVALVNIALLRAHASAAGISEISQKGGWIRFRLEDFDLGQISALYARAEYKGRVKVEAGTVPVIALKPKGQRIVDEATVFVRDYAAARNRKPENR